MSCWSDPNQISRYDARAGYDEANHVGWNQTIAKGSRSISIVTGLRENRLIP